MVVRVDGGVTGERRMRGKVPARAIVRVLTLFAVLVGLFLMHGLPAQACSGGTGMSATVMTQTAPGGPDGQALVGTAHALTTVGSAALPAAPGHGAVCLFVSPPRGIDALLALLLLAAAVALVRIVRPPLGAVGGRRRHRAPPRAGMELLTRLCVSRT